MPIYNYSLAEQRPELFRNCRLPTPDAIPVSYEGRLIADVVIPESGIVTLDISHKLIELIESGKVLIMVLSASLLPHDEFDDFQIVSITGIEMFDRA